MVIKSVIQVVLIALHYFVFLNEYADAKVQECMKSNVIGFDYIGRINTTVSGKTCQPWGSQYPHSHKYTNSAWFPDDPLTEGTNYCRDPEWETERPWCYTTDPDTRWEFCDIPRCHSQPECRYTDLGVEYRGSLSVTKSGKPCQKWDEIPLEKLESLSRSSLDENFCRNPSGNKAMPWCYVEGGNGAWEHCDVPFCKPPMNCKQSDKGEEYVGTISMTRTGRLCQRWDRQYPHPHSYTDSEAFPDESLEDADNYCRNPGASRERPWCYTIDPDIEWEYCHIDTCQDCKTSQSGREYSGVLSKTKAGLPCQRWDVQSPHPHSMTDPNRFPDKNLSAASNYCRNPDKDPKGPWCYTTDDYIEKDYCHIPDCPGSEGELRRPIARHVVHIGIDGLKPSCMLDAPGGAVNMMQRLASLGSYTLTRARTSLVTTSSPGWSNVLCGMNIENTGIKANSWIPTWRGNKEDITPVMGGTMPLPCIFRDLKAQDQDIRTAMFYDWDWLKYMANVGFPGMVDWDKFEPYEEPYLKYDWNSAGNASEYLLNTLISSEKSYTMLYLVNVDETGHDYTWCSKEYLEAVNYADQMVGLILDTVDNLRMADDVMIVVTSDHGGLNYDHGDMVDHDLMIPMFIRGPQVKANHQFEFEVENKDIVPTTFYALGLKNSPWWNGEIIKEAFENV